MSYIITKNPNVEAFAARLLNEPYFKDGTYTLYADVPVKCIRYLQPFHVCGCNPCSDRERYAHVTIDYVVCHGDTILLCICFDEHELQHDAMFKTYLHGMDYVRHHFLSLECEALEQLYAQVTEKLHFLTDYSLTGYQYALVPVAVPADLQELQGKRFLCDDPMSIAYTRDCGLFSRCSRTPEGRVLREPLTSDAMSGTLLSALNWVPKENYCTNDLRKLLDMPLPEFFNMRKDSLHFLQPYLSSAKRHMGYPADRKIAVYGDCLRLLVDIQQRLRSSDISTKEWDSLSNTQRTILLAFCQIMSKWYIPIFQLPLHHYFAAAANLAGCYYPLWLYRSRIEPHLCNRPKDCVAVMELVQVCIPHILPSQQPAVPFMVNELMVAPICVPNAQ